LRQNYRPKAQTINKICIMRFLPIILIGLLFTAACKPDSKNKTGDENSRNISPKEKPKAKLLNAELQNKNTTYRTGDIIDFDLNFADSIDAQFCKVFLNRELIDSFALADNTYKWNSSEAKTGKNTLAFELRENGNVSSSSVELVLLSDIKPRQYKYKVVNVYPHDSQAYTQGLFYEDGFLYEATGLRGESTVRRVKLETGEVVRSFSVPSEIFGEGITYYDDKIVQLSWDSGRGFVYRFSDFKLLQEFRYNGEGWGLDHFEGKLYMTDGSHTIRILNDQTYSLIETLDVYDNEGPVQYLNELEFINGKLWANIYRHEKIVIIDPKTGKAEGNINLKRLLPMNDYTSQTDVLNGIAYDKKNNRIFVTGKKWPKLFEIEIY
jgi:glutaminyl-peptide cyclotransferase